MNLKKIILSISFVGILLLTACSSQSQSTNYKSNTSTAISDDVTESFYTTDTVHSIVVDVDDTALSDLITAYQKDGSKNWTKANVTIDGTTFEKVGLKLKGNSTLRDVSKNSSDDISFQDLPWVIRLDKYVDNQSYNGRSRFVVRGNNSESSMNEAVSLTMLTEAGIETEDSAFTRFSVNGSDEALRLVIDVPDDDLWTESHFGTDGLLYKAQSSGDYSYQGTDVTSYENSFEQKYGEDNMTPLITFLEFINNSTDEEFSKKLDDYLDVDAFATYLVMQDLVANDDAIDGPGNNAYLYYSEKTKQMTVVAWDQNLSFGGMGGQGYGGMTNSPLDTEEGGRPEGLAEGMSPPNDTNTNFGQERPEKPNNVEDMDNIDINGKDGKMGGKENILVTRFLANETFSSLVDKKRDVYTEAIIGSNFAQSTLDSYKELLSKEASDLIDSDTLTKEKEAISKYLANDKKKEEEITTSSSR